MGEIGNTEVSPCPFCGAEAIVRRFSNGSIHDIHCTKCPASISIGGVFTSVDVEMWNKRIELNKKVDK